ncbi:MAG: phage minor head protein, partial [Mariprofundaceae bacterium]|nr:phage minor head protein [Mariprofundaceae bacterium]
MEIHAELLRAKSQGVSGREFVKRLKPRMKALGWWGEAIEADVAGQARRIRLGSPYRLRFIYRQNMQSGYMAGRWKSQKENADARPWWQYVSVPDSKTRPGHRALHGRVFRHDDPFWDAFYPPNGWNCRCRVRALSDRGLRAKGLSPESSRGKIGRETRDISVNKRTGEVTQGEISTFSYTGPDFRRRVFRPDPGWSYNPGSATYGSDIEMLRKLTAVEHVGIRAQAIQAINNSEVRHALFASWVDQVLNERVARSSAQVVGLMDDEIAAAVRARGKEPARVMVVRDRELLHADRKLHHDQGVALSPDEWAMLPEGIA